MFRLEKNMDNTLHLEILLILVIKSMNDILPNIPGVTVPLFPSLGGVLVQEITSQGKVYDQSKSSPS